MKNKKHIRKLISLPLFIAAFPQFAYADVPSATTSNSLAGIINIEGTFSIDHYMIPHYFSDHGIFRVWIDWPRWNITYESQSSKTNKWNYYCHEISMCNEEGVYILRIVNKLSLRHVTNATIQHVKIYPGNIPPPYEGHTYHIWLGTMAQLVWTNKSGLGHGPNISDASLFINTNALCKYEYNDNGHGMETRELVFRQKGTFLGRNVHKKARLMMIKLPSPYTNGYHMATVRWKYVTNYHGLDIPMAADIGYYVPVESAISENQIATSYIAMITITNIFLSERAGAPSLLQTNQSAFVRDYRFQHMGVGELSYFVTNSLPPANDRKLIKYALNSPKKPLEHTVLTEMGFPHVSVWKVVKTYIGRLLLVIVILFPMFVAAQAWVKKHSEKSKNLQEKGTT